ncbi:MAG: D-alanyl-D-alanine carboxypeptidase [Lachnospiraceae bacterium]|nr:D-alanyl-D-alanine carboxypeptidase [Lachnospiraceae bacterium]
MKIFTKTSIFTKTVLSLLISLSLVICNTKPFAAAQPAASEPPSAQASVSILAKSAVLIENNSGRILFEKEKDTELVPASITKIMTLLLIFEALHNKKITLEDSVSTSEFAASMGGSQVFLEPGETQTVDTMIKCISIASANDAAVAMAEHVSGSETEFVKKMNEKAKELGMVHTSFKNCNGLDDSIQSGHYSSAYDVALMSRELITKYPEISNYSTVWMDEITHTTRKGTTQFGLTNTNKLIRTYNGITGLKTGSTSKAKYCLSATAERNGVSLTAVIMAAPDPKERFAEAAALLDYGFSNCTNYSEKASKIRIKPQKIINGVKDQINSEVTRDFSYTLCGNESSDKIEKKIMFMPDIKAPVKKGDKIGNVVYILNGKEIDKIPIKASEDIGEAGYITYFQRLLKRLLMAQNS